MAAAMSFQSGQQEARSASLIRLPPAHHNGTITAATEMKAQDRMSPRALPAWAHSGLLPCSGGNDGGRSPSATCPICLRTQDPLSPRTTHPLCSWPPQVTLCQPKAWTEPLPLPQPHAQQQLQGRLHLQSP